MFVACGCRVLSCVVVVFIGACHWLAWSGCCFSSLFVSWICLVKLLICLLCVAAMFSVQLDFCSGPVTGLLAWAAAFREVGFI